MINEVYKNIFKVEVPLPKNPLRELHCYIIKSEDRNLVIDTGFNTRECREALLRGLKETGTELKNTDILITHLHSDHSGLAEELSKQGAGIYAGEIDAAIINDMCREEYWNKFRNYIKMYDLKKDNVVIENHPGLQYCTKQQIDFITLREGDKLNIGEYNFQVVDIPGHTPGHIGLYERKFKLFFCGDLILGKITPNISFWGFEYDILQVFFDSLKKVYNYDIEHLFTAHRDPVPEHKGRIQELMEHHMDRLREITDIIRNERMSVRDIAARMKWDVKGRNWSEFPDAQKCFASGEAMSHLEHLYRTGRAERTMENEVLYYKAI